MTYGGGWRAVRIPHYTKHDIPGRLLPRARASLAQLTREARAVAVAGRCTDLDFPVSHVASLAMSLESLGVLEKYPMVKRYWQFYSDWRAVWGKKALTAILYGGVPDGDGWNPVTWTLASQVRAAGAHLLSQDHYAYLKDLLRRQEESTLHTAVLCIVVA